MALRCSNDSTSSMLLKPSGRPRFDRVDNAFGAAASIHVHDLGGHRQPRLLVGPKRVDRMFGVAQQVGEASCIENGLGSAVRAHRIHRMGGVAQQRDTAVAPARQRIAIAHRIFPELVGRLDQARAHRHRGCGSAANAASDPRSGRAATSPAFAAAGIDASPTRPTTAQLVSRLSGRDPSAIG